MIRLERVIDALPAGFEKLRAEARGNGHRMLDTLAAEWSSGVARFDRPGEVLYAAYADNVLAGVGGLTLEPAIPGALRMRRFYVRIAHRRGGVGYLLAEQLLEGARRTCLPVTANAAAGSEAFWEALGFVPDRRDGFTHILNG
ncbi:MAG TPA: GNAT family N-acetyltransferase [Stellaceae bacterium]|jgi:hypothetical protein|nr:GNAT family N-acetyltransferase [Stellaceae bacterium]